MSLSTNSLDRLTGNKPDPGFGSPWFSHILYIVYSLGVGVFLLFLPWMDIWENNYIVYLHPVLRPIVTSNFLKGGVLGLGLVNIFIGIQEIANLRKGPKRILSK
jgi:hypothetical protein